MPSIRGLNKQDIDILGSLHFLKKQGLAPFTGTDTSVGMEHELQVAVEGNHRDVDLPIIIRNSRHFNNTVKRTARGDLTPEKLKNLTSFLENNEENIWENSWVYFSESLLHPRTIMVLNEDMLVDKRIPGGKKRSDHQTFRCTRGNNNNLRIPVSYLLKLALIDSVYQSCDILLLRQKAEKLAENFTSDNTSPEILSFNLVKGKGVTTGVEAAEEGALVFLVSQLLSQYANKKFELSKQGQKCIVYNAPQAPIRQKKLNELVPEGFYRHLFMSPCLSGWDKGEEKHRYMALCHRTLSNSQLNTIARLKDAEIIKNNLTILPNTSNTCLANNGTHISLGSASLTQLGAEKNPHFNKATEKYFADLVIKIVEHFLPLLVNTYTAAPYRIDFSDCHPENILGFLPHELDYTHLRMIWRRWKKKADLNFMGKNFTPFGPRKIDQIVASAMRLQGDFIPDYRLIDYLVSLRSTGTSPALNGQQGNQRQLKKELSEMGIFDSSMSIYLPYRMRSFSKVGYSGFEGRSYSLFQSFSKDMAEAVSMQNLITAYAYKLVIEGKIHHSDIPDTPSIESERRQIFFGTALGIPTFYINTKSSNRFLHTILSKIKRQRNSRRYKGYIRVENKEYQNALVKLLQDDAAELIQDLGMGEGLALLQERLSGTGHSTLEKIVAASNRIAGCNSPMKTRAETFNKATEKYCRTELKQKQTSEGIDALIKGCIKLEKEDNPLLQTICSIKKRHCSCSTFLHQHKESVLAESCSIQTLETWIQISLAVIHHR